MTARDAPEVVIRNILRTDWNSANTSSVTPNIHHGWLDVDFSGAEVTISNPEESPLGGATGFTGMKADGSGPTQEVSGTLAINCWTSRERVSSVNPRKLAYEMKVEVERILMVHAQGTDQNGDSTDLHRISYLGAQRFVENEADNDRATVFRYQVTAGYAYLSLPA